MNIQQLNPWRWLKHEKSGPATLGQLPVTQRKEQSLGDDGRSLHPMFCLHNEIDRLINDAFFEFYAPFSSGHAFPDWGLLNAAHPKVDVAGDNSAYQVQPDVPNVKKILIH